MTVRYYKYNRNARAAARRVGLDPDVVVQPAPAGFYSVDFGDIEPTEPEPQGDGEPQETVAVEPQPEESTPEAEESAPVVESTELEEPNVDVALANAHLDGIPAFLQRAPESGLRPARSVWPTTPRMRAPSASSSCARPARLRRRQSPPRSPR